MKRRAIIILHPDFDAEGTQGIRAAFDQVNQYKDGNKAILEEVKKRGVKPSEYEKFQKWIESLKYLVRTLDTDELGK